MARSQFSQAVRAEYTKLTKSLEAVGIFPNIELALAYANAVVQLREAQKELASGMTITLSNGNVQPSPWIAIRDSAVSLLNQLAPRLRVQEAIDYKPPANLTKGRPAKIGDRRIIDALWASGGIIHDTARLLNAEYITIRDRVAAQENMQRVLAEIKAATLDLAKGKHMEALRRGEPWAIAFYLKCFGKEEGWIERPPAPPRGEWNDGGEVLEGEFKVTVRGGLPIGPPPPEYEETMPPELAEDAP